MFKLEILDNYYRKNRQVGHTLAMLNGAKSDKNIILLVAHNTQMRNIDLPDNQMININNLERIKGLTKPIIIDHYALQLMYWEMKKELDEKDNKIIGLEALNKILRNRVKAKPI